MASVLVLAALVLRQQAAPPSRPTGPAPTAAAIASDTGTLRHPSGRVPPVVTAERAEVRFAYHDEAIYVGARMFDAQPARIAAQLGRRDNLGQSDGFNVTLTPVLSLELYVQPYVSSATIGSSRS